MSKYAQLPDGTTLEFPDDTQDSIMDSVVKKHLNPIPQVSPTDAPFTGSLSNIVDMAKAGFSGLTGNTENQDAAFKRIQERNAAHANTPIGEQLKGAATGAVDLLGAIPGMVVAPVAGIASGLYNMDATKGLQTAQETMKAMSPSTWMGADTSNPGYQEVMTPFSLMSEGISKAGEGYGKIAGVAGASPEAQKQIQSGTELGFMAGLGLTAARGMKRSLTPTKNVSSDDFAAMEELSRQKEQKVPQEQVQQQQQEVPQEPIKSPQDLAIEKMKQDAQVGNAEMKIPTEEQGLSPSITTDELRQIMEKQNQSKIDAEMGGGIFIRDRERINELTKDQPKAREEGAAWDRNQQEFFQKPIDPDLRKIQEDLAWEQRSAKEEGPMPSQRSSTMKGFGDKPISSVGGLNRQRGAVDLNGIWDGLRELVAGTRVLLKVGGSSWTPLASTSEGNKVSNKAPNFDKYIEEAKQRGFSEEVAKTVYQQKYGSPIEQARGKLGLGGYKKIRDINEALDIASKSADLKKVESSPIILNEGRQWAWSTQNKGLTSLVDYAETARADAGHAIEQTLRNGKDGVLDVFQKLRTLNKDSLVGIMKDIRENQFNENWKPTFKNRMEETFFKSYKKWEGTMFDLVNNELVRQGKKTLNRLPNWFPSIWSGDFSFAIKVKDKRGTGERIVFLVKAHTRAEANKALEYFKNDYGQLFSFGGVEYTPSLARRAIEKNLGMGSAMDDIIKLLGDEDPLSMKAKEAWEAVTDRMAYDTAQYKQHFKHKVGVRGHLGDAPWKSDEQNLSDTMEAIERSSSDAVKWVANQKLNEINKQVQSTETVPTNIKRSFQNYTDSLVSSYSSVVLGNKMVDSFIESMSKVPVLGSVIGDRAHMKKFMQDVAAVETLRLLAYKSQMAIQQELSPIQVLLPKMVELAGQGGAGAKDISSAIVIGHLQGTKLYAAAKSEWVAKNLLNSDEKQMLDYARKNEVADLILIERDQFKNPTIEKLYRVGSMPIREVEAHSRFEAFTVMSRYFRQSGYSMKDAMEMADNVSLELMGNYADHVRSSLFKNSGIIGQAAGRLQSFKIFQMTQAAHYLRLAKNTGQLAPVATLLGVQAMLGGTIGVIGMDAADTIMEMVRSFYPEVPTIKESVIKHTNDTLAFGGLSTMTDSGLFGSFNVGTIGDLSWKGLFPIVGAEWESLKGIMGVAGNVADKLQGKDPSKAEVYTNVRGVAPAFMNKYLENKLMRDNNGSILSPRTNEPVYVPDNPEETKPNFLKDITSSSIPSFKEAKDKTIGFMASRQNMAIRAKTKEMETKLTALAIDMQNNPNNQAKIKAFNTLLNRYIDLAGPAQLDTLFSKIDKNIEDRTMGTAIDQGQYSENPKTQERSSEWKKVLQR